jgi:hypothetical protein
MTPFRMCAMTGWLVLSFALTAEAQSGSATVPGSASSAAECPKLNGDTADHAAMDHAAHLTALSRCAGQVPTLPGQAAFGAITEVVQILKADPKTDWSKVNIEALRQHLIDMDEVTMHSTVSQRNVPGGIQVDATGSGRGAEAIKRMLLSHTKMLDEGTEYHASATTIPGGARMTVTAKDASDPHLVAVIRGLGFAGLMTEGAHHALHHLAIARGESSPHAR